MNNVFHIETIQELARRVRENVGQVIVGQERAIELLLVALVTEGHVLLEDVPGIGKTSLARALAASLGCSFSRIQFTPDLLPSDVTGIYYFNQKSGEFEYRAGPIFAQIVLADKINRAGPRTQSALLEAMQERQVTVEGVTHALARPFLVLATQNPVELEGTFPLPEAQVDRFLMRLSLGYPAREDELAIVRRYRDRSPLESLQAVASTTDIVAASHRARQVYVHPVVEEYIVDLARASREEPALQLGVSPRGTLGLYHASQALAALRGRDYVLPDDVKYLTGPVLTHRLLSSSQARLRARPVGEILQAVVDRVPVPVEEVFGPREVHVA